MFSDHAEVPFLFVANMADRLLLCMLGVVVSCYSLHVEVQHERTPGYRAACDFNQHMSCSRVLTSRYGRGFGVVGRYLGEDHPFNTRNCSLGIVFYIIHAAAALLLSPATAAPLLLLMSATSVVTSLYLAYILFVILRDVCVVCITVYVINGLLCYLNYALYKAQHY